MPKAKPLKQLEFGFMRKKKGWQKIQRLLGSTKEFHAFHRLGGKLIGEKREKNSVKLYGLSGLNKTAGLVAYGRLDANPSENNFPLSPLAKRLVKNKRYGAISYGLEEMVRTQEYLRKGIGTRVLKSLEEMARNQALK